eukprot:scpid93177/ scgid2719/ 
MWTNSPPPVTENLRTSSGDKENCNAAAMDQVLSHVLAPLLQCSDNPDRPVLNLLNCSGHITRLVHLLLETCHAHPLPWLEQRDAAVDGRIGSRYTELLSADRKSSTAFDGNEVYSATSLKSCWANTCVFKGQLAMQSHPLVVLVCSFVGFYQAVLE